MELPWILATASHGSCPRTNFALIGHDILVAQGGVLARSKVVSAKYAPRACMVAA